MYLSTNHQPQRQRPSLIATTMPVPPASSEAPAPTLPVSLRPRAPIPALVRRELEYTGYQGMPGKTYEESCALCDASGDFSCSMTCFQRWIMQLFRQLTRLFLCIAHQMIRQIYRPHQLRTSQTLTYSISPLRPLPIYGNINRPEVKMLAAGVAISRERMRCEVGLYVNIEEHRWVLVSRGFKHREGISFSGIFAHTL